MCTKFVWNDRFFVCQSHRPKEEEAASPTLSNQTSAPTRTYTCQLCKKQFDQRLELSRHQCIELSLKLLKKKKDMRKKKWREAHWKRKIDLSYIESTSLASVSQNIADNLSFCIDGTSEDLKAYSREVKDYLSTELGNETQTLMVLRSLGLYEKVCEIWAGLANWRRAFRVMQAYLITVFFILKSKKNARSIFNLCSAFFKIFFF